MKILLLTILFANIALADSSSCIERKKTLCSKECELVVSEKNIQCQGDCINEYCAHVFKEKKLLEYGNCASCLDEQFKLCNCEEGSSRVVSECRLKCAKQRCAENCK